jgi:hypothetical protein
MPAKKPVKKATRRPKPETTRQKIGQDDARAMRKRKMKVMDARSKRKAEQNKRAGELNKQIGKQQGRNPY